MRSHPRRGSLQGWRGNNSVSGESLLSPGREKRNVVIGSTPMLPFWNNERDMASDEPKNVPSSTSLRLPRINPITTTIRFIRSFNESPPPPPCCCCSSSSCSCSLAPPFVSRVTQGQAESGRMVFGFYAGPVIQAACSLGYTRRHMLGPEHPEAVSPGRGVVLTDLLSESI